MSRSLFSSVEGEQQKTMRQNPVRAGFALAQHKPAISDINCFNPNVNNLFSGIGEIIEFKVQGSKFKVKRESRFLNLEP
ncbi:MAG TPA: hypothetical protein VGC91_16025 [Pyrinomonadaceae bacterium]|jgi:hypothetical protein